MFLSHNNITECWFILLSGSNKKDSSGTPPGSVFFTNQKERETEKEEHIRIGRHVVNLPTASYDKNENEYKDWTVLLEHTKPNPYEHDKRLVNWLIFMSRHKTDETYSVTHVHLYVSHTLDNFLLSKVNILQNTHGIVMILFYSIPADTFCSLYQCGDTT